MQLIRESEGNDAIKDWKKRKGCRDVKGKESERERKTWREKKIT